MQWSMPPPSLTTKHHLFLGISLPLSSAGWQYLLTIHLHLQYFYNWGLGRHGYYKCVKQPYYLHFVSCLLFHGIQCRTGFAQPTVQLEPASLWFWAQPLPAHSALQSRPSCELRRAEIPSSASSHVTVHSKAAQRFVKASFCHLWRLQVHYAFSTCWWLFLFCVQVVTGHFLIVAGGQGVGAEKGDAFWTQEFTEKMFTGTPRCEVDVIRGSRIPQKLRWLCWWKAVCLPEGCKGRL